MIREKAARAFILILLGLVLYLLFQVLRPFLSAIAWALFFVTVFHPAHQRLKKLVGNREWPAAILMTALIATVIVLPGVFVISNLADSVPPLLQEINSRFTPGATATGFLGRVEEWIGRYVKVSEGQLHEMVIASLGKFGQALTGQIQPLLGNILATLIDFLVMIVTMAFLFKQGASFIDASRRLLPLKEKDKEEVFARLKETTRAIFYGVILTAFIQGTVGAVGWMIVGLPNPLFFGIAMFFAALVPFVGTALVWVPGSIYLYLQGFPGKALILLLWGGLIVATIDTFLRPIFISGRTRLHILLVFFGIFGGLTAFGATGFFLGPLVIALALFLIEVVRRDLLPSDND
jgi:predicted PurR-regulated permease PerM